MKSLVLLFFYFFTWRSTVTGSVVLGAGLLVLALNALLLSPYLAFSISVLAYLCLLLIPYLSTPIMLRNLISSRSTALTPYLAFKTGLALLLLTLFTAAFLPLVGVALARPGMTLWFGPKIFILASLYTGAMQLILTSKHMLTIISVLPLIVILLLQQFGIQFLPLASNNTVILGVCALTLGMWGYALWVLAHRHGFQPMFKRNDTNFTQHTALQGMSSILGFNVQGKVSAAASLLFAYPASWLVRSINVGSYVIISPLFATVILMIVGRKFPMDLHLQAVSVFLANSLFYGCISCWSIGEIGARARLLWLRMGGNRADIWHKLELELGFNFAVMAALLLVIVVSVKLIKPEQEYLLHYVLIVLACAGFDSYLNLCSRLYQWPSALQSLVMLVSFFALVGAIIYSLRFSAVNLLGVLEVVLGLLALFFRGLAKWRFLSVDWLVLKHEISKRAMLSE